MGEALLKVLLVDDEPFILQGLKILIDWEQEGFEVVKTAANGEEALEYLRGEQVDLRSHYCGYKNAGRHRTGTSGENPRGKDFRCTFCDPERICRF